MAKHLLVLAVFLFASGAASAADCIKESDVTKWEVISKARMVAYTSDNKYLAFVSFWGDTELSAGKEITLRLFSPTICGGDTVILNGKENRVTDVKLIRQQ